MGFTNVLLFTVIILNILLAVVVVFLERRNAATTWAWLMILTFIPVLGFLLYVILGQNLRRRKIFRWDKTVKAFIRNEAARQMQVIKEQPAALLPSAAEQYKEMIYMHLNNDKAIFTRDNHVDIMTEGKDKFKALLRDIQGATKHIHLLYYIIRSDQIGNRIAAALAQKAREGVQVRVLYDASGSRWLSKRFVRTIRSAGGEIVSFFPARLPYLTFHLNYRNHRKIAVIDGRIGYIGGFNIGDEYLGLHKRFGYWRDTHLRIQGTSVNSLQTRFLLDWNQAAKQELPFAEFYYGGEKEAADSQGQVGIQIVSSGPDSQWEQIKKGFIQMILSARQSVYIQTPYFIPDDSVLSALKISSSSGIDVRIMVPGIADHPFVYWATQSYFGELLRAGAKIYRYQNGFLHAKTIVIDGQAASVGTANMDMRSFRLNFEVNAFLYDPTLAEQLSRHFLEDVQNSIEITMEAYQQRSLGARLKESIYRLLSPIL